MSARCSIGGNYRELPTIEPGEQPEYRYEPPCLNAPTHRYRASAGENWGYRCAEHAAWLDPAVCTIEPLGVVA